jgi:hypothetical protein
MMMQLKRKKHAKKKEQIHTHKKTCTNTKNETHAKLCTSKNAPPKNAMCVFFINENKNATLISNKDEEEKRQEKEREN